MLPAPRVTGMRTSAGVLGLAFLLAGCSGSPAASNGEGPLLGEDGEPLAAAAFNYTTLHAGGEQFTRTYQGSLTPDEAAQSQSVPFGASPPSFQTCCSLDLIPVTDLLETDQLVALRLTLHWTNTQTDQAGFDVATCLPWACLAFNQGPDESQQPGEHTDVLTVVTSGRQDFEDNNIPYAVGVRYTNAVLAGGMPYTIDVEAFPVGDGLAAFDPYTLNVADNATVVAELVGPYEAEGVSLALMVYDERDRPVDWIELAGPHGSRHNVTLPAGDYVVVPMRVLGGFVRLSSDRRPESLEMERLEEEFSTVPVSQVADSQAHEGTFTYQAPPGTIDPFPVFLYGDGAAVQDSFGLAPADLGGAHATLRSSSGDIAVVDQVQVYAQHSLGSNCLQCNFFSEFNPENYIDDDGTYELDWSSEGASGSFVLFTAKYLR
jgi:hypothetical protein